MGNTRVICMASVEFEVPRFLKGSNQGWITAEYGMLPGATDRRTEREAVRGKQSGRSVEIQRLIGRSLRRCVHLDRLGETTIRVDCDVIQADAGTRTASITGGCVAIYDALRSIDKKSAFADLVAAISVGVVGQNVLLDLDYSEDSRADTDMNVVMCDAGGFIEVQGTAEGAAFSREQLNQLLDFAGGGISQLFEIQKQAIES